MQYKTPYKIPEQSPEIEKQLEKERAEAKDKRMREKREAGLRGTRAMDKAEHERLYDKGHKHLYNSKGFCAICGKDEHRKEAGSFHKKYGDEKKFEELALHPKKWVKKYV